jgi:hypothetical protein
MSETVAKLAARKGRLPALIATLAIFAWMTLVAFVQTLVNLGWYATSAGEPDIGLSASASWSGFADSVLGSLPIVIGVFVALWAIAPISHELEIRFVLTRAALAAVCGSILAALVHIVMGIFTAFHGSDYLFSNSLGAVGFDFGLFFQTVIGSIIGIITGTLGLFPLVALVVVLLWLWLRDHPRSYEISGLIDEL